MALSTDGTRFVGGATGNHLQMWNTIDGMHIRTLGGRSKVSYIVAISPHGSFIASASVAASTIRVWDTIGGKYRMSLRSVISGAQRYATMRKPTTRALVSVRLLGDAEQQEGGRAGGDGDEQEPGIKC